MPDQLEPVLMSRDSAAQSRDIKSGSISKTYEVTVTGGETVTTGCGVLKPFPRTRRDFSIEVAVS